MTNDLTAPQGHDLAKAEELWLLCVKTGVVHHWTPYLAVKPGLVDCTAAGEPIRPEDVPGDHPWIKKTTTDLREQLAGAGADDFTLQDVGRSLTEQGKAKFRQLEYKNANRLYLESKQNAESGLEIDSKIKESGDIGGQLKNQREDVEITAKCSERSLSSVILSAFRWIVARWK